MPDAGIDAVLEALPGGTAYLLVRCGVIAEVLLTDDGKWSVAVEHDGHLLVRVEDTVGEAVYTARVIVGRIVSKQKVKTFHGTGHKWL
jgi:hypothetical protein